jgi:hypothetical protein
MNLSTELPLYESIRRELLARIESGELREGDRIVPEIDLAKQLGVSRSTARKALQCLTDAGLISRTAGRGSFVLPQRGRGRFSGSRVLELAICPPESALAGSELARGFLHESLHAGCAAVAWPWNAQAESWPNGASGGAVWACGDHGAAQTYLAQARRLSMPSVVIDAELAEDDCVTLDHAGLCRALAKGLLDRGHRSVAILTGPQQSPCTRVRLDAARETFSQASVQVPAEFIISGAPESRDMLRNDLLALLGRRDRPKGLLCLHEGLSRGSRRPSSSWATRWVRIWTWRWPCLAGPALRIVSWVRSTLPRRVPPLRACCCAGLIRPACPHSAKRLATSSAHRN